MDDKEGVVDVVGGTIDDKEGVIDAVRGNNADDIADTAVTSCGDDDGINNDILNITNSQIFFKES
eukprot:8371423-Ditylum_brightwellii.AAC.1